jgi:ketosteroid isomerase-like protein
MTAADPTPDLRRDPREAVQAWWRAMQQRDIETLERLAVADYVACGGPDGRTTGRKELLEGDAAFFAEGIVDNFELEDFELRELGAVAVSSTGGRSRAAS